MTDNTIGFKVVSDSSQAQADLRRVNTSLNKVEDSANSTAAGLASLAAKLVTAFTGVAVVSGILKTSDAFTNLQNKLKLVTDSTQQLVNLQDDLLNLANATRSSVEGTTSVYSSFAKSVKDSQSGVLGITKTVQQAVALSGGAAESSSAAILQLSQGLQSGTLRGEELNSVMEQTPALARAIAAGMGKSLGELRSMGTDGLLTTEAVYAALKKQADAVNKEFEKTSITMGQARQNISGASSAIVGEVTAATGMTTLIANSLNKVSKAMLNNKEAIVNSVVLASLSVKKFNTDMERFGNAVAPIFRVLGVELERMVPVIKFMQLNLSAMFNIEALVAYGRTTRFLTAGLADLQNAAKNAMGAIGANYKSDFFRELHQVVLSGNIPELERRMIKLAKVIESPTGMDFFKNFDKVLAGDTELITAMMDAISIGPDNKNFRDLTNSFLEFRQFLAMLGLVENKLFVIGNIRLDKLSSLLNYFTEIGNITRRVLPYAFTDAIAAFQKFGLAAGSYMLEIGRNTTGLVSMVATGLGKIAFRIVGFSAATDTAARAIYNAAKGVISQWLLTDVLIGNVIVHLRALNLVSTETFDALHEVGKIALETWSRMLTSTDIGAIVKTMTGIVLFWIQLASVNKVARSFENTAARIRASMGELSEDIKDGAKVFIGFVKTVTAQRSDFLVRFFDDAVDSIKDLLPRLRELQAIVGSKLAESLGTLFGSDITDSATDMINSYWISAKLMFDKILNMTTSKLNQIVGVVERFAKRVKWLFFDIYDKVVGHSYWPDMIEGVISWANKLDSTALKLVESFTSKVGASFREIQTIDLADPFKTKASMFSFDADAITNGIKIVAGAVILGISAAIFSPALFAAIGAFLVFEVAKSIAVSTDKMIGRLFNISAFEEVGKAVGSAAGALIKTMISQIPDMFNSIMQFSNGFFNGFLTQFGLIGEAIKGIALILSGGNIGMIPLMLFGAIKAEAILKSITGILGETKKVGESAAGKSGPADGLLGNVLGKINAPLAMAGIVALMSAVSSEISIFQAGLTATPLLLSAFLGPDVTGKLILDSVKFVLVKITGMIASSTAAGGLVGKILESAFGANGKAVSSVASAAANRAKSVVESVYAMMSRVTDDENRKAYLSGNKSFKEFAFTPAPAAPKLDDIMRQWGTRTTIHKAKGPNAEQAKATADTESWFAKMKKSAIDKGSLVKDFMFGKDGLSGMQASFASAVQSAADLSRNAVHTGGPTVMDKVVGTDPADIAAKMAAATGTVKSSFWSMSATADAASGGRGLLSRLLFGKVGAIAAIILASNLITRTAEAGVQDMVSKASSWLGTAMELGFIGAFILGTSGGRAVVMRVVAMLASIASKFVSFKIVGQVVNYFIRFSGVFIRLAAIARTVAAAIFSVKAALLALAGWSLYSLIWGKGDTAMDRLLNGLKQIVNLVTQLLNLGDAFPDADDMKPARLATAKTSISAARSISIINKPLAKDVEERLEGVNFETLTKSQAKQLQDYNKMISEQVAIAKSEIKELGEVSEPTEKRIKDITEKQEQMLQKLKKGQNKTMLTDALKLSSQIQVPTNEEAKKALNVPIDALQKTAAQSNLRLAFPTLDFVVTKGVGSNRTAIDGQIDEMISKTITKREELKSVYDDLANDLRFSFEKLDGQSAPLLDPEKYNKPLSAMIAAVANATKELQQAEEGVGFFRRLGFSEVDDARVDAATQKLQKLTEVYLAYVKIVRGYADQQAEIVGFQNDITATQSALKELGFTVDKTVLFNNTKYLSLKLYADTLKGLREQLGKVKDQAEGAKILIQIDATIAKIDANINNAELRGTVKKQIEGMLKDAGISGIDWTQILALKPDVRARVMTQIQDLGTRVNAVNLIPAGSADSLKLAAEGANNILATQQAITGAINASANAADSFATKMMQGASASAEMLNSARMTANPKLAKQVKEIMDRQAGRDEVFRETGAISASDAKGAVDDEKKLGELRSQLMGNAPKATKVIKNYIEKINERLNKAGVSINAEKLFALQPDVQDKVEDLVQIILKARDKLTKLPVNKSTGLPDMKAASAVQKLIDDSKLQLDRLAVTYASFEDMVTDKFKIFPDKISADSLANLTADGIAAVLKIASDMEAAAFKLKFDPSKSMLTNLLNFKSQNSLLKKATKDIATLVGVSIEDSLKALNLDWNELFGLKPDVQKRLLDTAKQIISGEKELETLRKDPSSSLAEIGAAEASLKALRATVEGNFQSFNSLKALGDTFSSGRFFKMPEAAQSELVKLGGELVSLQKIIDDFQTKGIDINTEEGRAQLKALGDARAKQEKTQQKISSMDFLDKNIEQMSDRLSKLGFNIDPLVIAKLGTDIVEQMRTNLNTLSGAYAQLNNAAPGSKEAKQATDQIKQASEKLKVVDRAAQNMQDFSNSMTTAGGNFVKGILTNTSGSWTELLSGISGNIVDGFSNRIGEFLFRDLANSMASELFGAEMGSFTSPMWVKVKGAVKGLAGGEDDGSDFMGLKSTFDSITGEDGIFGKIKGLFSEGGGISSMMDSISGLFSGGSGGGGGFGSLLTSAMGLFGFSEGGYTGNGGKFEPKGVVHGGEFVINKESTKRLGLGYLSKLNSFKGYSSGGLVGGVASDSVIDEVQGAGARAGNNQTVNLEIVGDISRQTKAEIYRMLPSIANGVNAYNREKGNR